MDDGSQWWQTKVWWTLIYNLWEVIFAHFLLNRLFAIKVFFCITYILAQYVPVAVMLPVLYPALLATCCRTLLMVLVVMFFFFHASIGDVMICLSLLPFAILICCCWNQQDSKVTQNKKDESVLRPTLGPTESASKSFALHSSKHGKLSPAGVDYRAFSSRGGDYGNWAYSLVNSLSYCGIFGSKLADCDWGTNATNMINVITTVLNWNWCSRQKKAR